jgi:putative protease
MEKLKVAIRYGADAVYLGGKSFGLRNLADNFSQPELSQGVAYAHLHGVKVYLTLNIFPDNAAIDALEKYLEAIADIPFDAYIVADPGVVALISELYPEREIHLSTQANTTNWRSAKYWESQGVKRVNLAREMSLDDIRETSRRCDLELEAFVHGAMCISYSGRCLISSALTGRDANRGECTQPCRWNYAIVEESRPGEYFPVQEDDSGSFIFNSKDLCLIEHLPELLQSGVRSLKIEGRMKGVFYLASVIRIYRAALDSYWEDPGAFCVQPEWLEELSKVSHRGYTTGFLLGKPRDLGQELRVCGHCGGESPLRWHPDHRAQSPAVRRHLGADRTGVEFFQLHADSDAERDRGAYAGRPPEPEGGADRTQLGRALRPYQA